MAVARRPATAINPMNVSDVAARSGQPSRVILHRAAHRYHRYADHAVANWQW